MPDAAPSPDALKQQRYRERLKANRHLAWCELPLEIVDALIDGGWVVPEASGDRRQLGVAVVALLGELLRQGKGKFPLRGNAQANAREVE